MREYGYSSDEVLKITEAVSTGLKLSGANTQEASSVITQFSRRSHKAFFAVKNLMPLTKPVIV